MESGHGKREISRDKLETLKKVPFFARLAEATLQTLLARSIERHYTRGQMIFMEGDRCAGLFIIHRGAVKILKQSDTGRELVLAIERRFQPLAELSALDDSDYPASAVALEETTLLFIPKNILEGLCHQHPEMTLGILKSVSARVRRLVNLVQEITFKEVSHRVARVLIDRAAEEGERTPQGWTFTLPMNNQELAAIIGTVRELVSRTLNRFHEQGIIRLEGRQVTILDGERLRQEMEHSK